MGSQPALSICRETGDGSSGQRREPLPRSQSPRACGKLASPGVLRPRAH